MLLLLAMAAGFGISFTRYLARHDPVITALARGHASVRVILTLTTDPAIRSAGVRGSVRVPESVSFTGRLTQIETPDKTYTTRVPVFVRADRRWLGLLPGTKVAANATVIPTMSEAAALLWIRPPPQILAQPNLFERWAGRVRAGLSHAAESLPADPRGLLPGLVIGDISLVPRSLDADMRTTGLTHLVAVSGANLAIVAALAGALLRRIRISYRFRPLITGLSIALFVVIVRPQPSVLRAGAMACVVLVATAFGIKSAAVPALAAAIFLLLLIDPTQAVSYGFALSVFATAGLLLIAPHWRTALARFMPNWLAEVIAVPLAAQVMCAPLIVALSGQVSIVAVLANALASPFVAPATVLGLGAALVSQFSGTLASALAHLAAVPAMAISGIAHRFAGLPFAAIAWPKSLIGVVLLAAITVAIVAVAKRAARSRMLLVLSFAALIALLLPSLWHPGWPPKDWTVIACDVGQGDGLVLNLEHGRAVVIDAGPDPRLIDGCLNELKITEIPLVILTHDHADHVEGLPGVLSGREVGAIWLTPLDEPRGEYLRVLDWAKKVPVLHVRAGIRLELKPYLLETLWPNGAEDSPNNSSIATLITRRLPGTPPLRLFLGGDLEQPAQSRLLASWQAHPEWGGTQIDILKVCHHGSANQDPGFLAALRPRVAVVSVGSGNRYGHPARSTITTLERLGVHVVRTDETGSIALGQREANLVVVTRGHRAWDARRQ